MIVLIGLALIGFAPAPLALLGLVLCLSQLSFSKPQPPADRKLPAQEWEW